VSAPEPTLAAITSSAVGATAASSGWALQSANGGEVAVVAVTGASTALGTTVAPAFGATGLVMASGQPTSITPSSKGDRVSDDLATLAGTTPRSILCVPCHNEHDVVGVLALIDKQGGGRFTIDDLELAVLLGGIAGVAMSTAAGPSSPVSPTELVSPLRQLAKSDPGRFASLAAVIKAVVGD